MPPIPLPGPAPGSALGPAPVPEEVPEEVPSEILTLVVPAGCVSAEEGTCGDDGLCCFVVVGRDRVGTCSEDDDDDVDAEDDVTEDEEEVDDEDADGGAGRASKMPLRKAMLGVIVRESGRTYSRPGVGGVDVGAGVVLVVVEAPSEEGISVLVVLLLVLAFSKAVCSSGWM